MMRLAAAILVLWVWVFPVAGWITRLFLEFGIVAAGAGLFFHWLALRVLLFWWQNAIELIKK